jgi:hypothetical protein
VSGTAWPWVNYQHRTGRSDVDVPIPVIANIARAHFESSPRENGKMWFWNRLLLALIMVYT